MYGNLTLAALVAVHVDAEDFDLTGLGATLVFLFHATVLFEDLLDLFLAQVVRHCASLARTILVIVNNDKHFGRFFGFIFGVAPRVWNLERAQVREVVENLLVVTREQLTRHVLVGRLLVVESASGRRSPAKMRRS